MLPIWEARIAESLTAYGAPLAGWEPRPHLLLEETIAQGLVLSHSNATILRTLPLLIARNAATIDWPRLVRSADHHQVNAELGLIVELAAMFTADESLRRIMNDTWPQSSPATPRHYFPVAGKYDAALAERRTPAVVRKWGFLMNMTEDSFRSMFDKHFPHGV